MTCEDCAKAQDEAFDENGRVAFVRIEEANVAIVGCDKHLKILIEKLRKNEHG